MVDEDFTLEGGSCNGRMRPENDLPPVSSQTIPFRWNIILIIPLIFSSYQIAKMALAMEGDFKRITSFMGKDSIDVDKVKETIDSYNNLFIEEKGGNLEVRRKQYMKMVNDFYDLVTHFYEYGWGQSFHFAPRHRFESFEASVCA